MNRSNHRDAAKDGSNSRLATKVEGEGRQAVNLVALDSVSTHDTRSARGASGLAWHKYSLSVPRLLGAKLLVDDLGNVGRKSNEGRSSVDGSTGALELERLLAKLDLLELDLPVALAADGDVINLARVVLVVDGAKGGLALLGIRAEPESEHGRVEQTLVDHVVERRDDVLDRNRVVGKTEDTVEPGGSGCQRRASGLMDVASTHLAKAKVKPGSVGGHSSALMYCSTVPQALTDRRFSKVDVRDLEVGDAEDIVRDDTLERAGSVLNRKCGAILLHSKSESVTFRSSYVARAGGTRHSRSARLALITWSKAHLVG